MTLPASGPISLLNLQEEFGGSNPIAINEYYRGGAYVSAVLTQIPASGVIDLNSFHGISTSLLDGARFIKASLYTAENYRYVGGGTFAKLYRDATMTYQTTTDFKTSTTHLYSLPPALNLPQLVVQANGGLAIAMSNSTSSTICKSSSSIDSWSLVPIPARAAEINLDGLTQACAGRLYGSDIAVFVGNASTSIGGGIQTVVIDSNWTASRYASFLSASISHVTSDVTYCDGGWQSQGGDGLFMLCGANETTLDGFVATAPDGHSWVKLPVYDAVGVGVLSQTVLRGVTCCAAGPNKLVAISMSGRPLVLSADGTKMDAYGELPKMSSVASRAKLAYGNGYFVCVGNTGLAAPNNVGVWTSTDGKAWTYIQHIELSSVTLGTTAASLEYHDGKFYLYDLTSVWIVNA